MTHYFILFVVYVQRIIPVATNNLIEIVVYSLVLFSCAILYLFFLVYLVTASPFSDALYNLMVKQINKSDEWAKRRKGINLGDGSQTCTFKYGAMLAIVRIAAGLARRALAVSTALGAQTRW